jgi:hypothetical protein
VDDVTIFDPTDSTELLRGWQLHTIRRRMIHERAARLTQRAGYALSAVVTVFAAVAGSSAFVAAENATPRTGLGVAALIAGLVAAIGSPLQSTLDLGGRAERHRQAAVAYKRLLRVLERVPPALGAIPQPGQDNELARELKQLELQLAEADAAAPIVPARLAGRIESLPVHIVGNANGLTAPTTAQGRLLVGS